MERIRITPVLLADADELIAANRANRAHHAPWAEPFVDRAGFEAWFAGTESESQVSLVARETASGGVVGVLSLSQISRRNFQSAYLGFYGMAQLARRGRMTEAVKLTVSHAFDSLGLHRIEANIQPDNVRSIALVRRAGFRLEGFSPRYLNIRGVWRDHERWARLADET